MAQDSGGGMGVLGVLVGALLVIVVGGAILLASGMVGERSTRTSNVDVKLPKVESPAKSSGAPVKSAK